jgi:hypothetical protein
VGNHRTADGRGDGVVDHFGCAELAELTKNLTNPIKNHHRFIHRVTQHSQDSGQNRQRKFPLEESKEPKNDHHIVQVGNNTGDRKLPLKAHSQVQHNAQHGNQQGQGTITSQLRTYSRANKFGTHQL